MANPHININTAYYAPWLLKHFFHYTDPWICHERSEDHLNMESWRKTGSWCWMLVLRKWKSIISWIINSNVISSIYSYQRWPTQIILFLFCSALGIEWWLLVLLTYWLLKGVKSEINERKKCTGIGIKTILLLYVKWKKNPSTLLTQTYELHFFNQEFYFIFCMEQLTFYAKKKNQTKKSKTNLEWPKVTRA